MGTLQIILIVLGAIAIIVLVASVWSMCVMAGRADRQMEALMQEQEKKDEEAVG